MRHAVLLIMICFTLAVFAEGKIYKIINADGTVSFSDTPSAGAQEVQLDGNMTTIQSAVTAPNRVNSATQNRAEQNYTLSILSPAPDATVRDNDGNIRIAAKIQPQSPGMYLLNFAGQQYTSSSGVFTLVGVDRGAHTYNLTFSNNRGKVIASSEERTVYLHQASVLIRRNIN